MEYPENLQESQLQSALKEHAGGWKTDDDFSDNAFHFYIAHIVIECSSLKLVFEESLSHLNFHLKKNDEQLMLFIEQFLKGFK